MNAPLPTGQMDRQKYLGGSDAAAYLGVSPWKTAVDLYLDKIKPREEPAYIDKDREAFFKRRKRQEPVVAEMLLDTYGIEVTRLSLDENPNRYKDAEHGFLAAEIDFEFVMTPTVREHFQHRPDFCAIPDGTLINGEIKTVHPFKASEWGEEGSEEVPIHYAAQGMHGLMILPDRPAVLVAALFGLDQLLAFPIMRDEETIKAMRAKAVSFWQDHVLARVPPEAVNLDDIKKLFGKSRGKPVELSEEIMQALRDFETVKAAIKSYGIEKDALEFKVAKFVCDQWGVPMPEEKQPLEDNSQLLFDGAEVGTFKAQAGEYLNQRALKAEAPALFEKHTVAHQYRVLRMGKPKTKKGKK